MKTDWQSRGNCKDLDPGQFFADRGRIAGTATSPCAGCPVRSECLDFAVSSPWEPHGIWGGLQSKEIKPLWRNNHPNHHFEAQHVFANQKGRSTP